MLVDVIVNSHQKIGKTKKVGLALLVIENSSNRAGGFFSSFLNPFLLLSFTL